ncbi:bifunctional metallophosphatase/5'-nucleotidase [Bacillus testis]|uniref:bifunctional metallophosphatase/5'-nucleotidase n=1 Tax=Bacillus testis TaxID=1622072 RepID=UPI00067E8FAB|nr:5'-nucleotidase C-terminal domain-containing protein [Bacillus testis]
MDLTVLHTNDTHANLDGIARTISAIKQQREEHPNNVLLSAGDVFSGTLYFNKFKGQADLDFMKLAKYDAMTFGNHEFDEGSKTLVEFVKKASFPFVSANVDFAKDELMKPYFHRTYTSSPQNGQIYNGIVKTINGQKVGIFGLTTAETATISSPGSIAFEDYIDAAKKSVAVFEEQGINKIIAVNHIGYKDGGGDNDSILANRVEGIDIIVGGHDHYKMSEPDVVKHFAAPTVIVQANEYNKYLGTLNVTFDGKGVITKHDGKLIEIDAKDEKGNYIIQEDKEAADLLNSTYKPAVDEMKKQIVAKSSVDLIGGNPPARTMETNLGDLIADGMLAKAKTINKDTVIALQNGGGVRTTIPAGNISIADVLTVLPFGNALGLVELSGTELKGILERSVKSAPAADGGFLQVAGVKYQYDSSKPAGSRVVSVNIIKDGKETPLVDTEKYMVATNVFTARGGDDYPILKKAYEEGRVSEPGFVDWEIFSDYLKAQPNQTISPEVEGRIVDIAKK